MIIDKLLQVSSKQAVTASAASTDVIDFGQANPNTGMDDRSAMVFTTSEGVTASGAATVTFSVQDCDTEGGTYADVAASGAIGKADLKAGAQVVVKMPTRLRRYCRAYYSVGTGPLTAGKFSAQIVTGVQQNTPYPDSARIA